MTDARDDTVIEKSRIFRDKFEIIKSNRINLDMPENDGEMICYDNN